MLGMEIYSTITTIASLLLGGGWFIHYRAQKRQEYAKASQAEADAFKSMQDAYQQTLQDVNNILSEVRADRDRYRDQRDKVLKDNEDMRSKYIDIETRMTSMDLQYKKDISRLSRKIDILSPFLCGVAGCMRRKKVNLSEALDNNTATQNA